MCIKWVITTLLSVCQSVGGKPWKGIEFHTFGEWSTWEELLVRHGVSTYPRCLWSFLEKIGAVTCPVFPPPLNGNERESDMARYVQCDLVVFFTASCHVKHNLFIIVTVIIRSFLCVVERELLNTLPFSEQCSPDEAELVHFCYINILNKVRLCVWINCRLLKQHWLIR